LKNFYIALILLGLTLTFVISVSLISQNALDSLIDQVDSLPESVTQNTLTELDLIEKKWSSKKELYSVLIKYDLVYNFSRELGSARAGIQADDVGTYLSARSSMLVILRYVRDVQKLRLDNLF